MLDRFAGIGAFFGKSHGGFSYAYAAFLGVLSALALPPYPFIPLFFVAIILMLLLLSGEETTSRAFNLGLFFGIGQFGFSLSWIANSFYAQADVPAWMGPIMVALLVLILSLFPALAFAITRMLWHNHWFQRALAFAGLYMAFEFLRSWEFLFIAFPWNPTSLVWWPSGAMLQTHALAGSLGLGLFTLLAAGLITPLFDGRESRLHRLLSPVAGIIILVALFGFGSYRLASSEVEFKEGPVYRLVQANIPQVEKWQTRYLRRNLDLHLELSRAPAGPLGDPDVLLWPETAVPYNLEDQATRNFISEQLPERVILTGAARRVLEPEPELNNSLYVLGSGGQVLERYDKAQLVPFGEFVPFRDGLGLIGLETIVPGSSDYQEGPGIRTLSIPGIPAFSALICYEIIFPGNVLVREDKPNWILNITNDAWFGNSAGPRQHFLMARTRAIEEGVPVIRVAGTGISAVIGPYGRVLRKLEYERRGIIDTYLPEKTENPTVFARFGIIPVLGLVVLFFLVGAGSGRSENGRKKQKP